MGREDVKKKGGKVRMRRGREKEKREGNYTVSTCREREGGSEPFEGLLLNEMNWATFPLTPDTIHRIKEYIEWLITVVILSSWLNSNSTDPFVWVESRPV